MNGPTYEITQAEMLQAIGLKQMVIEFQTDVIRTLQEQNAALVARLASATQPTDTASEAPVVTPDEGPANA